MLPRRHHILLLAVLFLVAIPVFADGRQRSVSPETAWEATYWNNPVLSGEPVLRRTEPELSFNWGHGSPAPHISDDHFSARWLRRLEIPAPGGVYSITATSDDGIRVWVDGALLIDQWHDHGAATYTAETVLAPGSHLIRVDYYENDRLAEVYVHVEAAGNTTPPGHTVIVDDDDPGFIAGGAAGDLHTAPEGHGGRLTWTRNSAFAVAGYNWGRWYPDLAPGRYELFAYVPTHYTTTGDAHYWITHRDGLTLRVVDQSAGGGQWVSLGTYWFVGDGSDYVSLADVTFETSASTLLSFDAMKWELR